MRALLVAGIIFGSLPFILYRPYIGIIVWTWISLMSPHRLTWGFAYDFPFAKIVGIVTVVAMLVPGRSKKFPLTRESLVLMAFVLWMLITTIFALDQSEAWVQLDKVSKIQLLVLVTMILITDRRKLDLFVWMIVLSVGFYGVKGGLFTLTRGGESRVFGPPGSFIEDNNHLGLALVMVIPLMRYLQLTQQHRWVRIGLAAAMILTGIATLGTQSRGAFLGIVVTLGFLAMKSRRRMVLLLAAAVVVPMALAVMPPSWYNRMYSIEEYKNDPSSMGRLNAWGFAMNLARNRPLTGGGFEVFDPHWFRVYAPHPNDYHDAHSVYFEVLGEHGFVGLLLFLTLAVLAWRSCSSMVHRVRDQEGLQWVADLARMCQVSMVGYATSGAFVGLAYFDLYYNVIAIIVVSKLIVLESAKAASRQEAVEAPRWSRKLSATTR